MDWIIEILISPIMLTIYKIVIILFAFVIPVASVLTLMERKWSALIQDRVGPNRANLPFAGNYRGRGLLHIAADGLKSFFKEDIVPNNADPFLFTIAPFFGFIAALATFAVLPFAGSWGIFDLSIADFEPGLLYIFAITSLGVFGTVLAGLSSNNKFSLLGGTRASAQMISYEVFMGLSLLGVFMVYETTRISEIVDLQNTYWFGVVPKWGRFNSTDWIFIILHSNDCRNQTCPF